MVDRHPSPVAGPEGAAMPMPTDVAIIDTMIGFPGDFSIYDFIRKQAKNRDTKESFQFPVEYMFKDAPKDLYGSDDPVAVTLREMDRFGVTQALISCEGELSRGALKQFPDRFIPSMAVEPNEGMEGVRRI